MRLAIVRRRHNPFGGAERFIAAAVERLVDRGVSVTIVTEAWDGAADPRVGVELVPAGRGGRAARLRRFQDGVAAAVAGRFDLVQTHERLTTADLFRAGDGVHAAWVDRLRRERGMIRGSLLALDPMHRLVMATERRMARETDMLFVANSPLVARELRQWLDLPDERVRLIENGVDLDRFRPAAPQEKRAARARLGLPEDQDVVAFVGSGLARKGAFHLADALARPSMRLVHAVIAGADRQIASLRRRVARHGAEGRVHVPGGVPDVRDVLAAADVFVLPSLYDPMPNAALEAIACGLPVIVTPDTGIATAVDEAKAGLVVSRDADDIAEGIRAVLADPARFAAGARELRTRFDAAAATERWLDLYAEQLNRVRG